MAAQPVGRGADDRGFLDTASEQERQGACHILRCVDGAVLGEKLDVPPTPPRGTHLRRLAFTSVRIPTREDDDGRPAGIRELCGQCEHAVTTG
jgi:hypothetical protein